MNAFSDEIDADDKLSREISECFTDFTELIQNELIGQIHNPSLKGDACKISFKSIIQHGLNALESAAHHGHLHLVNWILNLPDLDMTESIKQVFSSAIDAGNFVVFDFALSWLDEHNQPIPTSIQTLKNDYRSLLHAVVSQFALRCSWLGSDDEAKVLYTCFDMAKLLIGRADIDVNASDWIFEMIEMLVNAGIDLSNIDAENQTFFELALSEGSPLLLKSIRWLALDKGIDIQFVQFSCFALDRALRQRVEDEFKAIREEQRALQSQ